MDAWIIAIGCVVVWSATYIWTEKLTKVFTDIELVLFRSIIAFIFLLILAIFFQGSGIIPLSNWKTNFKQEFLFLLLGITGQFGFQCLSAYAVRKSNAITVSVVSAFEPSITTILVIILALIIPRYFLMPAVDIIFMFGGIVLATFGCIIAALKNKNDNKQSKIYLALIATTAYVIYAVLLSLIDTSSYDVIAVTRRSFFYGIVVILIINAISLRFRKKMTLIAYTADVFRRVFSSSDVIKNFILLGIVASALCFTGWQYATLQLGVVQTNLLLALTPIGTFLINFFYCREFNLKSLAGSLIASFGCGISIYFTH